MGSIVRLKGKGTIHYRPTMRYTWDMNPRSLPMLGALIGGSLGGYLPSFFGSSSFSMAAILWSLVGGIAGIWVGYRLMRMV